MSDKFRLVTRSDFDGLVTAVLFKELDMIDEIAFVHPKDMQDGKVAITGRDITTNLPYVEGCHLAFDHHHSETLRVGKRDNYVIDDKAPSAARVVYDYYGGKTAFPRIADDMMVAVDRADTANWEMDDVLHPQRWPLLSFIMDARTGLGRFREFRISNYQLMMELIELCRSKGVDEILAAPDVKERVDLYEAQAPLFKRQLHKCGSLHGDVVTLDLREEETIHAGNRFMIYALFPSSKVSVHIMWGRDKKNVVLACGRSIFDRSSPVDIGALMLQHGGGGHPAAGTCQIDADKVEAALPEIIKALNG